MMKKDKKVTSGVDFARIIQPMKALNGYKDDEVEFDVTVWDVEKQLKLEWMEVAKDYDVIFFNYIASPENYAMMGMMARKFGRKLVCDVDDALWKILPDNPAYNMFKKGSQQIAIISRILDDVDKVTCTNGYLRNLIADETYKRHENIEVLPNYVDLDLYSYRPKFKDTMKITIAHFGSTTHFTDLQGQEFFKGMDRIMKEYPNVEFVSMGCHIPQFKKTWGMRYIQKFGDEDLYTWVREKFPKFVDEVDIFVAPLSVNTYNICKSDIKRSEASTSLKPFVGQNIRQYQECITDGVDGMLCSTEDDWYSKIKRLIDDKELRRSMGLAGFERVKKNSQMKNHVVDYANFFKKLVLDTH
jgi:glycosyltransferase involved in cell wall biosynthesis